MKFQIRIQTFSFKKCTRNVVCEMASILSRPQGVKYLSAEVVHFVCVVIMCKLKRIWPQNILKILYNSLILPHLQYCILSWGFKSDRIFKLQKRAVRIITCSKYNAHTEPLLKTLNLLKIEDIMKTKALKLYYRYKQNELPKYFESMFTESNDNHSHDTRHKSLLYQLPTKTSTGRLCIRHYIPELLSKTPECITEKLDTHSFSGFSNYMKHYYIRNYNENCLIESCYICQK